MTLRRVIYGSAAVVDFSEAALERLLENARANNERRSITGLLLYADRNFLQIVEGPPEQIDELLEVIQGDRRHQGVYIMVDEAIEQRDFPDWQMGFRRLESFESELPGFAALLESEQASEEFLATLSKRVVKMIESFRRTTRS